MRAGARCEGKLDGRVVRCLGAQPNRVKVPVYQLQTKGAVELSLLHGPQLAAHLNLKKPRVEDDHAEEAVPDPNGPIRGKRLVWQAA
jgi:hypothetical protein